MRLRTLLVPIAAATTLLVGVLQPTAAFATMTRTCDKAGYTCVADTGYSGQNTWGFPTGGDAKGHNCTAYAAYRLAQNGVAKPGSLGDAGSWAKNARAFGIVVDQQPAVGAIAEWDVGSGYTHKVPGDTGHVAYVEAWDPSAHLLTVSDDTYGGNDKRWTVTTGDINYPSNFIHFSGTANSAPSTSTKSTIAFQANTGSLWTYDSAGAGADQRLGMMTGTSPAITTLTNGATETAFQANTGNLWVVGNGGGGDTHQGMMAGTSPAITALPNGGYVVAFQANTGSLYTYASTGGPADQRLGMMSGTSPAITTLTSGATEIAFQANTGNLWAVGGNNVGDTRLGMMAGTSPAITATANGAFTAAFQANTGSLWTYGSGGGGGDQRLGMKGRTGPAITTLSSGATEIAFQANTGNLWVVGNGGGGDTHQGMMTGTSPAITALSNGGYTVAFQANTTDLYTFDSTGGPANRHLGMLSGTSPCIASASGGSCGTNAGPPAPSTPSSGSGSPGSGSAPGTGASTGGSTGSSPTPGSSANPTPTNVSAPTLHVAVVHRGRKLSHGWLCLAPHKTTAVKHHRTSAGACVQLSAHGRATIRPSRRGHYYLVVLTPSRHVSAKPIPFKRTKAHTITWKL